MELKTVEQLYNDYIAQVWKSEYEKLPDFVKTDLRRTFSAGFISATSEMAKLQSQNNAAVILSVEAVKAIANNNNAAVKAFNDWVKQAMAFTDVADILVNEKN